jgi:L-methionine (R)-S-oxide reductase
MMYLWHMAEELVKSASTDKSARYETLLPQIEALMDPAVPWVANMGNAIAALKETFDWLWVGVYLVRDEELILGPFQGPIACTRITKGKGVCGTSWLEEKTIVVPDVDAFPGHIACSSASRSEIVVPLWLGQKLIGVLDVDSTSLAHFDDVDAKYLEKIAPLLASCYDV